MTISEQISKPICDEDIPVTKFLYIYARVLKRGFINSSINWLTLHKIYLELR